MKSEVLSLIDTLDQAKSFALAQSLNGVGGVAKIAIQTAAGTVNVDFDETRTSVQELRAVLHGAGFRVKRPAHGEAGMCCGGCGG
jgi:hypothetical protein